jgi:hypothetical protein
LRKQTTYSFSDKHPLLKRGSKVLAGLALLFIGPILMFLPFFPGFSGVFPIFFIGIAVIGIGFPLGVSLLIFGDFPVQTGKPRVKYRGIGAIWRSQQSADMIFGRTPSEKDPTSETRD